MKKNVIAGTLSAVCAIALAILFVLIPLGGQQALGRDPLTPEERAWLTSYDGKIRLGHDPNARPIEYIDDNGEFQGLAADYVRLIEKRLGFKFNTINEKSWDTVLRKAKSREIDVICAFTKTKEREEWMLFTEPYIVIPIVILTRDDVKGQLKLEDMKMMKVTFTKGWIVEEYLVSKYSDLSMIPAINEETALNNLLTGKADAWVTALTGAATRIEKHGLTNIRIAGQTDLSFKLAFASRKDWPVLNRILKKGLSLISEHEKSAIFNKWIHIKQESIFQSRKFWTIVIAILVAAILPLIVITTWNKTLKKKIDEKTAALALELKERRRAEEELRDAVLKQRAAVSAGNIGLWDWDLVTNNVQYSAEWKHQIGYKEDEIGDGLNEWKTRVHPDDLDGTLEKIHQYIDEKQKDYQADFRFRHRDGSYRWIMAQGSLLKDDAGRPVRMLGSHVDITDRKNAEANLKESEQKFRDIFNHTSDAIFIQDMTGRFLEVNEVACSRLGHPRKAFLKMMPSEIDFSESAGLFHERSKRLEHLDQLVFEAVHRRKDGSLIPVEINSRIIEFDGNPCILSVARDITDRKETEKERKMLQIQLNQAQRLESIGTLAGGIAHDFNNILFPIIGLAELLLEDLPKSSLEYENARQIMNAGKRGRDLVKQILAFSRQSEHKQMPVRLQQILKEVVTLMRSTIPANINIIQNLQHDCGMINADPTQIHQVAMNLITNAYHAVEHTDGEIWINLKETTVDAEGSSEGSVNPGRYALLEIVDNGTGIEPDIIDKIFEPYFTSKETGKGSGIGLAVVYGIVKKHGGEVKVESEVGKGTTFRAYFPLIEKDAEEVLVETTGTIQGGKESILLVDDEAPIVNLQAQMLSRLGYRVTVRTSSTEALQAFLSNPLGFDLVISDMTMPNMTGDKLAQRLIETRPDIPIIICTGFSEKIDKEKAAAIGVTSFLMKPVIRSELAESVRNALDNAPGRAQR